MLRTRQARGFSLPEALIAIAIMVAGLAGSASMLLQTVRQERESANRRAAIRIASSIADQLRAIRRPDARPVMAVTGIDPDMACRGAPANCAAEHAALQLRIAWAAEAAHALPQAATITLTVPDHAICAYLISIAWAATGGGLERLDLPVST